MASPAQRQGVTLLAIGEQPAWSDPVLAAFFQQLRGMLGWPRERLAAHLGTSVPTIALLEGGHLRALPPWPETQRILKAYGRLVAMDLDPVARRIRPQIIAGDAVVDAVASGPIAARIGAPALPGPGAVAAFPRAAVVPIVAPYQPAAAMADRGNAAPSAPDERGLQRLWTSASAVASPPVWLRVRRLARIGLVVAGLASAVLAAHSVARTLEAAVESLPGSLAAKARGWFGSAKVRKDEHGLTWIDVADPRSRKADRLPQTR